LTDYQQVDIPSPGVVVKQGAEKPDLCTGIKLPDNFTNLCFLFLCQPHLSRILPQANL